MPIKNPRERSEHWKDRAIAAESKCFLLEAERDALRAALQDIAQDFARPEKGQTDFGERQHYLHIACRLRDKARAILNHGAK